MDHGACAGFQQCISAPVEEAVKGGGSATWGSEGYYFAENGDFVWGDVTKAIAKDAHKRKLIPTAEIDDVTPDEADKLVSRGSYLWGMNSRARAIRVRKLFGTPHKSPCLICFLILSIKKLEA